jgi:hypothetical protein
MLKEIDILEMSMLQLTLENGRLENSIRAGHLRGCRYHRFVVDRLALMISAKERRTFSTDAGIIKKLLDRLAR